MEFSEELIEEITKYLTKKTGRKPNDKLKIQFLQQLATLGKLFKENSQVIGNDS